LVLVLVVVWFVQRDGVGHYIVAIAVGIFCRGAANGCGGWPKAFDG